MYLLTAQVHSLVKKATQSIVQMGRGALKVLKMTGPVGVALGAAGLCYSDAIMDEGTRRAISMYAAFGTHNCP